MAINPTGSTGSTGTDPNAPKKATDIKDLDANNFLTLLITELQNQDPLNPMDNAELVQQVSSIREISATSQLTDTLTAVTTSQNLASSTALMGKTVKALTDKGADVTGKVDKVTVEIDPKTSNRTYRVHVGTENIQLKNVREVLD